MKTYPIFLLSLLLLFLMAGCDSDKNDDAIMPEEDEDEPASWAEGFPVVYSGTHTLKVAVSITKPGKIYYVVSNKALEKITGAEIKTMATSQSAQEIKHGVQSGVLVIGPGKTNDTTILQLDVPTDSKNYFSYFIAEGQEGDSVYFFADAKIMESVNFLPPREKEESFYSTKRGKEIPYLFYALEVYYLNPKQRYPLLVFLHGKGEYGSGNKLSLYKNGIIPQLIHQGMDLPFVVVAPQIDTGRWDTDFVDEFIDHVIESYTIDEDRIYMTGNSLGGVGTWEYVGDFPKRLAAIVPISGEGDTLEACLFTHVPVWAFHNAEDGIMDVQGSKDMIEALQKCVPSPTVSPKLTIYPDKGHNAWMRTYDLSAGNDIYNWMLSYSRTDG